MARSNGGKKKPKATVGVEESTGGRLEAGTPKTGRRAASAERQSPTAAQLDARQAAVKARRKAPGPARAAQAREAVSSSDVPPCEPQDHE